jgi:hypothetical protein
VRGLCGTNPRRVQTRVISGFLDNDEVPESLLAADALVSITVRNENASPITRRVNAVARPQNEARTSRYQRRGHELGGRGHTTADGIDRLRLDAERAALILLCAIAAAEQIDQALLRPFWPLALMCPLIGSNQNHALFLRLVHHGLPIDALEGRINVVITPAPRQPRVPIKSGMAGQNQ